MEHAEVIVSPLQRSVKCAVNGYTFCLFRATMCAECDKLCRGDKMCRNRVALIMYTCTYIGLYTTHTSLR